MCGLHGAKHGCGVHGNRVIGAGMGSASPVLRGSLESAVWWVEEDGRRSISLLCDRIVASQAGILLLCRPCVRYPSVV